MLRVHILNVGHGDCTIIKHHSGRLTMIDINNSQDYDQDSFNEVYAEESRRTDAAIAAQAVGIGGALNTSFGMQPTRGSLAVYFDSITKVKAELTDPIGFLRRNYPGERIWRFVLTHPDLDHMRGLKNLYENIGIDNIWDTSHTKPTPNFRGDDDKDDWGFYQSLRTGNEGPNHRYFLRGDRNFAFNQDEYGFPGGDNIEILSPTQDLVRSCNAAGKSNSLSLVLRVSHAGRSVLLPGDAEADAWEIMADFYGNLLKSDFLKASHHGRDTGYHLRAVQLIAPLLTFASVGRKPDTDASSKYRQQCDRVASTRYHGNIEVRIHDNGYAEWFVDRNRDQS
jgi:competence protein ComEC